MSSLCHLEPVYPEATEYSCCCNDDFCNTESYLIYPEPSPFSPTSTEQTTTTIVPSGLGVGPIVGIAVGLFAAVFLGGVVVCLCVWRQCKQRAKVQPATRIPTANIQLEYVSVDSEALLGIGRYASVYETTQRGTAVANKVSKSLCKYIE